MGTSLQFLKLGTYDTLYSLFPPVICHVLKARPAACAGRTASDPLVLLPCPLLCQSSRRVTRAACQPSRPAPWPPSLPQKFMVRYTKQGQLDGETNLDLPPLTERSVEARPLPLPGCMPEAQPAPCWRACPRWFACACGSPLTRRTARLAVPCSAS
jgi:hypothetical protein